jgi:hypothetical protein
VSVAGEIRASSRQAFVERESETLDEARVDYVRLDENSGESTGSVPGADQR